jgi:uncharacterized DUF497 family protein
VRFDWDEVKNRRSLRKHGIDFETAILVFEDPYSVEVLDRVVYGEDRWQTVGVAGGVTVLVVAHTLSEDVTRIISARKATPLERRSYEEAN